MRKAAIYIRDLRVGTLTEDADGYLFAYNGEYVDTPEAKAVSLTLPLSHKPYRSNTMFPFFDGLIPEDMIYYRQRWFYLKIPRNWH
jgi:serine/threonine-protein kinase HipA